MVILKEIYKSFFKIYSSKIQVTFSVNIWFLRNLTTLGRKLIIIKSLYAFSFS